MHYYISAPSFYGKSHLIKELLKKLQNESQHPTILMLLVQFPDEWKSSQKNSDNEVYLKPGNQIMIYDKNKFQIEQLFQRVLRDAQNLEYKRFYKVLFWDDSSQDNKNYSKPLLQALTCGRHYTFDVAISNHYLTNLYKPMRAHIKDIILGGPQSKEQLKKYYKEELAQYFDKADEIEFDGTEHDGYNFNNFWEQVDKFLNPLYYDDDEDKKKVMHRFIQISLPCPWNPTPKIQFIEPDKQYEQVITNNALHNLLSRK